MRCAVYVRVSTDMETQKTSIAHQINFFEKYIKEKDWKLWEIYQDRESGTSIEKREGLKKLLRDSQELKFDIVLTKSISRFARNTLEGLGIIRALTSLGIRFIAIEDGFDTVEYDEFMLTLFLSMAQKESEKISQRIRFGKLCRARQGYYNGSAAPYGYKKVGKNEIEPSKDISTLVVQKIFEMYLGGCGLYKIAQELNHKGYPTPSQKANKNGSSIQWHQSTIKKILVNPLYVGDLLQNKSYTKNVLTGERQDQPEDKQIYLKNVHRGIIDRTTFQEVQRLLERKKKNRSSHEKRLFSGLLTCGECGSRMHFKKDKEAYICGRMNKQGKVACNGAYVWEKFLIELLRKNLQEVLCENLSAENFLEEVKREAVETDENHWLKDLNQQLHRIEGKKSRLLELFLKNGIDSEEYQEKKQQILAESTLLEEKKKTLLVSVQEGQSYKEKIAKDLLNLQLFDREVIQKLIENINIFREKHIEIEYRFRV